MIEIEKKTTKKIVKTRRTTTRLTSSLSQGIMQLFGLPSTNWWVEYIVRGVRITLYTP